MIVDTVDLGQHLGVSSDFGRLRCTYWVMISKASKQGQDLKVQINASKIIINRMGNMQNGPPALLTNSWTPIIFCRPQI